VTRQNNEDRSKVSGELSAQVEKSENEVDGLRRQLKLKTKELRHIRRLSQMILDQRSEVEQFFIEALELVKLERGKVIEEERRQAKLAAAKALREHAGGPRSQRALAKATAGDLSGPAPGGDKVYLKDLTLEDRERVLRLLFAKINIAHKATKPAVADFNDEEFDDGRADSQAESQGGGFYLTQMDEGYDEDEDGSSNNNRLPEIPNSRGSNR